MSPHFIEQQRLWGQWLRAKQPDAPLVGIAPERAELYRQLIRNNLHRLYGSCFPVCRQLPNLDWPALIDEFIASHRARTPLFHQAAAELVEYLLQQPRLPLAYLAELAHYEWLELDLSLADAEPLPPQSLPPVADWSGYRLSLSPLSRFQAYQYPVHRIGRHWQPTEVPALPSWLLLQRDAQDQIQFTELSPALGLLLSQPEQMALAQGLQWLASQAQQDYDLLCQQAALGLAPLLQQGCLQLQPLQPL